MKILMPSCDKYKFLVDYNKYFIKSFWKNHPEIISFGYKDDGVIGKDFGWVSNLKKVLEQIKDDYVCLIQDDVILVNEANDEYLNNEVIKYMDGNNIDFYYLLGWIDSPDNLVYTKEYDEGHRKITPNSPYTIGTHPGIWRTEYMRKVVDICLKNNIDSPWEFELKGSKLVSKNNLCENNLQIKRGHKHPKNIIWEEDQIGRNPLMFTFGGVIHGGKIKDIVKIKLKKLESKLEGNDLDMFLKLKKDIKNNFNVDMN